MDFNRWIKRKQIFMILNIFILCDILTYLIINIIFINNNSFSKLDNNFIDRLTELKLPLQILNSVLIINIIICN